MKRILRNCGFSAALCLVALTQSALLSSCERPEVNSPSSLNQGARRITSLAPGQYTYLDTNIALIRVTDYTFNETTQEGTLTSTVNGMGTVNVTKTVSADNNRVSYIYSGGNLTNSYRVDLGLKENIPSIVYTASDKASVIAATSGGRILSDNNENYFQVFVTSNVVADEDYYLSALAMIHNRSAFSFNRAPKPVPAPPVIIGDSGETGPFYVLYATDKNSHRLHQKLLKAITAGCDFMGMVLADPEFHISPNASGDGFVGHVNYGCYDERLHRYVW